MRGGEGDELDFGGFCTSIFINIWTALAWLLYVYSRKVKGGQKDTDRIFLAEGELKTVDLVLVQRVVVEDADVHLPFFEVVGFGEGNSRGEVTLHLRRRR